eukprot:9215589-Alexandrium_andersonii.AAC.1
MFASAHVPAYARAHIFALIQFGRNLMLDPSMQFGRNYFSAFSPSPGPSAQVRFRAPSPFTQGLKP